MNEMKISLRSFVSAISIAVLTGCAGQTGQPRPNIILLMADDQGWGQTGYYNHPVLKTPNLDAMAESGLRLDRFYAGAPVCSPTRASVLTGRANDRTGVPSHGHALRLQEKTIAEALKAEGYATGHFGKWHLNALRGPGVPIFRDDPNGPAAFGFDRWVSVTNFFDVDPLMSDQGEFKEFKGTSSEVIVSEALKFIRANVEAERSFFVVIWDGSPHSPWVAGDEDSEPFSQLDPRSRAHYGELVAFDRSVGILRETLRELDAAENTILWYCSDNGGLPRIEPSTTGGLRDFKGSVWEGGLRVPSIIEWPAVIKARISDHPASTMDIFPTLVDILSLPQSVMGDPVDGISIKSLFTREVTEREVPIPFRFRDQGALIDNNFKLVATSRKEQAFELYDLEKDPGESSDISGDYPEVFEDMISEFQEWSATVDASVQGRDYPEGKVSEDHPESHFWMEDPRYEPYLDEWVKKPEYERYIRRIRQ
jgi:arylsulfatase A-like enzyme